jgi:hypothetical protein
MNLSDFLKHPNTVGLLKAIAGSPGDPLPRHLLADHAEEHGFDNVAKGQRWAAKHGKQPEADDHLPGGWYRHFGDGPGRPEQLPHFMLDDEPWNGGALQADVETMTPAARLWGRSYRSSLGNLPHETDFLHRSHEIDWDDEGEPLKK